MPAIADGQTLGISYIKMCNTFTLPISDLGVVVSVFDITDGSTVFNQNDTAFGVLTYPYDGVTRTTSNSCQDMYLTKDDQLSHVEIESMTNQIMKMTFKS